MKASDFIARFLAEKKVEHIFELSGGMITHILDSVQALGRSRLISMHHEQATAFAADAVGRITGVPGVAMATSGPGATNLLTGIGSCYFDSVPAVFITGQVNTHEMKGERGIRQLGFQEADIIRVASPLTKESVLVRSAAELPAALERAFKTAVSDRPGPVLLDIPMNVQREEVKEVGGTSSESESVAGYEAEAREVFQALGRAKKPLLILGRGVRAGGALPELEKFLTKTQVPAVLTLLGLDALAFSHPCRVGFFGAYGNRWSNQAIAESDLVVVLGARLDIRQTGADTTFFGRRKIYHVDCESAEINNRVTGCVAIKAQLKGFLQSLSIAAQNGPSPRFDDWFKHLARLREQHPDTVENAGDGKTINPNVLMHELSSDNPTKAFVADVGCHQMWAAQSIELSHGQQFLTSGGMGAMGYSLPAAIGASLALSGPVTVVVGDGSLQVNIQELQTVVRNKLPLKIIVVNNQSLGMIRQFQDSYFESRHQSTVWGYSAPDFAKIGGAYGIESKTVESPQDLAGALKWLKKNPELPQLLDVKIARQTNAWPKIAFGRPLNEMEPDFKPQEIEST